MSDNGIDPKFPRTFTLDIKITFELATIFAGAKEENFSVSNDDKSGSFENKDLDKSDDKKVLDDEFPLVTGEVLDKYTKDAGVSLENIDQKTLIELISNLE
jgi:hypothetical protein